MSVKVEEPEKTRVQDTAPTVLPPVPKPPVKEPTGEPGAMMAPGLGTGVGLGLGEGLDPVPKPNDVEESPGGGLKNLVAPKVFRGPDVDLQSSIVDRLETAIKRPKEETKLHFADPGNLYVGSIELTSIPVDPKDDEKMVQNARLTTTDHALGEKFDGTAVAKLAGVQQDLVTNSLKTMIKADQIDYLRRSGIVGKEWKVVIEVHYYRQRTKNSPYLHKDTLGQTLFVNLNYTNKERIPGPEFIVSPPLRPSHEQQIEQNLPPQFMTDLEKARSGPQPEDIQTQALDPYSVVSFVDEAIHHATPLGGHRKVTVTDLKKFLQEDDDFKTHFKEAESAYNQAYPGGIWDYLPGWTFGSYFTSKLTSAEKSRWKALIGLCKKPVSTELTRPEMKKLGQLTDDQIDRLLEKHGPKGYTQVSIPLDAQLPGTKDKHSPIGRGPSGQPRKRAMSQIGLQNIPKEKKDVPRRFFRTWVRAVRVVPKVD